MKSSLKELKLQKNKTEPYFSDGEFSMHELLERLLEQTGPAVIAVSSFSITELAVRTFQRLTESGMITNMRCLFDLNVKRHKLDLLFFSSNVTSGISLTKNHSKMIIICNDDWYVAVVSSANFNNNDKKEVGIISAEWHVYEPCIDKFNTWYNDGLKITADDFR